MIKYFTAFILLPVLLSAQNFDRRFSKDFIEEMNSTLNIRFGLDNDLESFDFNNEELKYVIQPNINYKMRLAVNYRFLSFKVGYTPTFFANQDSKEKGKTKVFKIGTDIFMGRWLQTIDYYRIKGYYVSSIETDDGFLPGFDEFIILPDLSATSYGLISRYKFNDRFSLKSLINQTEIQRKSAGSFIPSIAAKYSQVSDRSTISDLSIMDLTVNAGYYYNFVLNRKWFINLALAPGIGYEWSKRNYQLEEVNKRETHNGVVGSLVWDLGTGYNSKSFFGGFNFRGNYLSRDENPIIQFNTSRIFLEFYIGYRFKAPHFVKRGADWIEENNPLN